MIRRDYLMRMIEEFARAIRRMTQLKSEGKWTEAKAAVDDQFRSRFNRHRDEILGLSETELLAMIMCGESTLAVPDKTWILIELLKEAGEIAVAQGDVVRGHELLVKALSLWLLTKTADPLERPEFVVPVDVLLAGLNAVPLPAATLGRLMQHYEESKEWAKAEDRWYQLLEQDRTNSALIEFGIAFYRRLSLQTDAALAAGNLPREEVISALRDLEAKLKSTRT
jgi:hypothetical protein